MRCGNQAALLHSIMVHVMVQRAEAKLKSKAKLKEVKSGEGEK